MAWATFWATFSQTHPVTLSRREREKGEVTIFQWKKQLSPSNYSFFSTTVQGCQIFLHTIYQNVGKYAELPQNCQMTMKNTKRP
jgi:hypothetical protein